jgi:hypothetical protein
MALLGFVGIAAGALTITSDSVTVSPDQKGTARAKCPRGSEAVAGGFASPAFDPQFVDAAIVHYDSHRTSDREWRTLGHNFARPATQMKADGDGELDAYAVCDTKSPPIVIRSKTKSIDRAALKAHSDPTGVGTAVAECPRGSEAISGGFASPDNANQGEGATYPFTSKRVGTRKWKVRAVNNDFQHRRKLKAFAYCDKSEPKLDVVSDRVAVPNADKRTIDLGCRHGDTPVSGGYASTFTESGRSAAFAFTSRPISDDRWRVSAFGSGGGSDKLASRRVTAGKLTAYVYCKR